MKPNNPGHQPAEQELIVNATKGDLDAFNQLVLMHQGIAYNHARAILRDPALADDATQDSFIKAFQNIRSFVGVLPPWLMRTYDSAYDILRQSHATAQPCSRG